jgi:hypothetical protein
MEINMDDLLYIGLTLLIALLTYLLVEGCARAGGRP